MVIILHLIPNTNLTTKVFYERKWKTIPMEYNNLNKQVNTQVLAFHK